MGKKVNIVEIGPRDGFQNVKEFIPTEFKLEVIDGLARSGFTKIMCTSFVSPKHISQMADAAEVARAAMERHPDVDFFALVPNFRGAEAAVKANVKEISPVISLSAGHNRANVNRTHGQSLEEFRRMRGEFPDLRITPDIATAFGCPFEGKMEIPPLVDLLGELLDIGFGEVTLCDTIGVAHPAQVRNVVSAVRTAHPECKINLHIHDTRNMGMLNSLEGVRCGVNSVQTSVCGLGGCPFAPGASGNTASEDFVYMLAREGYDTGIDFAVLLETAKTLRAAIDGNCSGHHINIDVAHPDFASC